MKFIFFAAAAALLAGCGASAPYSHVLVAPEGVDRWEPSGATVLNDRLWVATDREGFVAAYPLPLKEGPNTPDQSIKLVPTNSDGQPLESIKWEDVSPDLQGGFYLLESRARQVWHCKNPQEGCTQFESVDVEKQNADISTDFEATPSYFGMEALAFDGQVLWMGSRHVAYQENELAHPYVIVTSGNGPIRLTPIEKDGRRYALSGFAYADNQLWQTWSFEGEGDTKEDVSGFLALSSIGAEGQFSEPKICRTFEGKPEGVAIYNDKLIIVFDMDKARKHKGDDRFFELDPNEDYATIIPANCGN